MNLSLKAVDIARHYNGDHVLNGCSWSFDEPGIYVLTGPNGSGKSTFLRICALLEKADKGRVSYFDNGTETVKDIALMRRITLVLPRVGLFNASVERNVSYGLRIRGISGREASERTDHALDFAGLSNKKGQNALTLSSGEAQRAGIARALVIGPEVLFLDEPTASVDEKNILIIEKMIVQLRERKNTIVVMTTHDRAQAERLADKVLLLEEGRIIKIS